MQNHPGSTQNHLPVNKYNPQVLSLKPASENQNYPVTLKQLQRKLPVRIPVSRADHSIHSLKNPFFNKGDSHFFSVQRKENAGGELIQRDLPDPHEEVVPNLSNQGSTLPLPAQIIIQAACNKMQEIRTAIENGHTWEFENEDLMVGEVELFGDQSLLQQRNQMLNEMISGLANIIELILSGGYPVQNATSRPYSLLASIFFETQSDTISYAPPGVFEEHPIMGSRQAPWMGPPRVGHGTSQEINYIRERSITGSILPAVQAAWWAPFHDVCSPTAVSEAAVETPMRRRYTDYWIHLADPVNQPTIIDGLTRGSPPSSLMLIPPGEGGARVERVGDSFPLMQEGNQYFYLQGERRIDLPNIRTQYPQLPE